MPLRDRGVATIVIILIVAISLALLIAGFLYFRSPAVTHSGPQATTAPPLSEVQKSYLPLLEFTGARMSASENFLGDQVTYLDAQIANKGPKQVRRLDVQLEFFDTMNQVVLRQVMHPVSERTAPLKPGATRALHVPFEHLPADWNQAPPRMTPVYLEF